MSEKREVKQCPYCSEEIIATAKKCKHCLSFIEGEPVKEPRSSIASKTRQTPKAQPPVPPSSLHYQNQPHQLLPPQTGFNAGDFNLKPSFDYGAW